MIDTTTLFGHLPEPVRRARVRRLLAQMVKRLAWHEIRLFGREWMPKTVADELKDDLDYFLQEAKSISRGMSG